MPIYLDEDMQGVCEVCGRTAKSRCADCKATFFCSRGCQGTLRMSHKKECRFEAALAVALSVETKNETTLESRSRLLGEGATCWICQDSKERLFHQGCACRGTAGYAHVRCVFEAAAAEKSELRCSACEEPYTGEFSLRVAAGCWRMHRRIDVVSPTTSDDERDRWYRSHRAFARDLSSFELVEEAYALRAELVKYMERTADHDSAEYYQETANFAQASLFSARPDALQTTRNYLEPHALAWRDDARLEERNAKLDVSLAFASCLLLLQEYDRALDLLRLGLDDTAQRHDKYSSDLNEKFQGALLAAYGCTGNHRDLLKVGNLLLDKKTRRFGKSHPQVRLLQNQVNHFLAKIQQSDREQNPDAAPSTLFFPDD